MVFFLLGFCTTLARAQDEDYLGVLSTINQAESLEEGGKMAAARTKYLEAQAKLAAIKKDYPNWNVKAVAYRMNYLSGKLAVSLRKSGQNESLPSGENSTPNAPASREMDPVKLLNPGGEPRQKLRYHPKSGDHASLTMAIKTGTTMQMAGQTTPAIKMPTMQMTLDFTVKNVAANGDITYEATTKSASIAEEPDVLPQVTAVMKDSLQKAEGMSATATMTSSGSAKEVETQAPADENPQVRQTTTQIKEALSSAAPPLPNDAIGVGAKWAIKTKVTAQGMVIDQTATYELVSMEGERITLRHTIEQTAANQKIQSPAMPALKVDLTKMTGHISGTSTLDLTGIVPITASLNGHSDMVMGMDVGGQKQTMALGMDQDVRMEAK